MFEPPPRCGMPSCSSGSRRIAFCFAPSQRSAVGGEKEPPSSYSSSSFSFCSWCAVTVALLFRRNRNQPIGAAATVNSLRFVRADRYSWLVFCVYVARRGNEQMEGIPAWDRQADFFNLRLFLFVASSLFLEVREGNGGGKWRLERTAAQPLHHRRSWESSFSHDTPVGDWFSRISADAVKAPVPATNCGWPLEHRHPGRIPLSLLACLLLLLSRLGRAHCSLWRHLHRGMPGKETRLSDAALLFWAPRPPLMTRGAPLPIVELSFVLVPLVGGRAVLLFWLLVVIA